MATSYTELNALVNNALYGVVREDWPDLYMVVRDETRILGSF
jgi:hypothetical protein